MAPSFVLSPLSAQNVVLEDQRLIAQCNICCENSGPTRKGYKCSAGDPACQYPACESCWSQIADGACPHCRRLALPYFDRQLTESTDACVITCQNAAYGCSWQGHYGRAQAHLEDECDARRSPEALEDLLATALRDKEVLRDQLNEAEGLAAARQAEKLFLEAENTELSEKIVREREEHARVASALRKEIATMTVLKSTQTTRLQLVEQELVVDRRLLTEERAEKAKEIRDLEIALEEKDKDLRRPEHKSGERRQRRRKHSLARRGRDASRSPRRRRRRSTRGRAAIRVKTSEGDPPSFAPPFPPFQEWRPPAFSSLGNHFLGRCNTPFEVPSRCVQYG